MRCTFYPPKRCIPLNVQGPMAHCTCARTQLLTCSAHPTLHARRDGPKYIFDDFREAYAWLRHNTHPDAKVASWWVWACWGACMLRAKVRVRTQCG